MVYHNGEIVPLISLSPSFQKPSSWINHNIPEPFRAYLELIRLDKPTGTILMFWPFCTLVLPAMTNAQPVLAWGLTMTAYTNHLPFGSYTQALVLFFCGAFMVRSSACTINDIFDRKMDAGVERTKNRPLASGRVSVVGAVVYLAIQYAVAILFFYWTLSGLAFYVALFQLLPLFAIYPLLKRITYWPQAWLGLCMNFGFVTAWTAIDGSIDYPLTVVSMSGFWCWTMLYGTIGLLSAAFLVIILPDTIYACQDIKDDVKVGVRSTAILFGDRIRCVLAVCAAIFVSMLALGGYINQQGLPFFVISVGGTASHLLWQFFTVDLDVPESCWRNFARNGQLGWIIWAGLMVDYVRNYQLTQ